MEMPAEYYAKAVPVMTPRVYRLAKLTNKSDVVLLPGEATVYVGSDFVGRMRLPLVAAGEPFVAGFGVDTQLQVSRRLVRKSRSVQGGNQIFDYEFRIGLRNYRANPVKVQLWDRLPKPDGEAVAVNLVKTTVELSKDASYQRTGRARQPAALGYPGAAGHNRRQDHVPELRVPPGIRPRPSPASICLRRPARSADRRRRDGHDGRRHGWHGRNDGRDEDKRAVRCIGLPVRWRKIDPFAVVFPFNSLLAVGTAIRLIKSPPESARSCAMSGDLASQELRLAVAQNAFHP